MYSAPQQSHSACHDGFETFAVDDTGEFPNSRLEVILYRRAITFATTDRPAEIERLFLANGWDTPWRNGLFPYHHFHATAHEVLGVAQGAVTVQLGGDGGPAIELAAGDIIVLPAGVAHRNIGSTDDLVIVGAYPPNQIWDINTGDPTERPRVDEAIARVPLPDTDPVLGRSGPVITRWSP